MAGNKYLSYIQQKEQERGLPRGLLYKVLETESSFDPEIISGKKKSSAGAIGIGQFIPATAKQYGIDPTDPYQSIDAAAKYLKSSYDRYNGDIDKTVASYNWGPARVKADRPLNYDRMPKETKNYIAKTSNFLKNNPNFDPYGGNSSSGYSEQKTFNNNIDSQIASSVQNFKLPEDDFGDADSIINSAYQQNNDNLQKLNNQSNATNATQNKATQNNFQMPDDEFGDADSIINSAYQQNNQALQNVNNQAVKQPDQNDLVTDNAQQEVSQDFSNINNNTAVNNTQQQNVVDKDKQLYDTFSQLSDDQIIPFVKSLPDSQRQALYSSIRKYVGDNPNIEHPGKIQNFLTGVGGAGQDIMNSIGEGVGFARAKLTGNTETYDKYNSMVRDREIANELNDAANPSISRTVGDITGQTIPFLTGVGATGATVKGMAASGALGALVGKGSGEDIDNYVSDRAKDAAIGAVISPVVGKTVQAVARPVAKLLSRAPDSETALRQEADRFGIDLLNTDVNNANPVLQRRAEDLSSSKTNNAVQERVRNNLAKAEEAFNNVRDKYKTFDAENYVNTTRPDLLREAQNGGKYADEASSVIDKLSASSSSNDIIKNTAEAELISRKIKSSELYDKAASLAPQNFSLKAPQTETTINKAINELNRNALPSVQTKNNQILKDLTFLKDNYDFNNLTLEQANNITRDLAEAARDAGFSGNQNGKRIINDIRSSLENNIDSATRNDPSATDFYNAYKEARRFNYDNIQSNKKNADFQRLFNSKDKNGNQISSDTVMKGWVKKGEVDRLKNVFDNLDEEGQNAVRMNFLNNMLEKANGEKFNVKAVNKEYNKFLSENGERNPIEYVFKDDRDMKSLMNVFSKIKTADRVNLNPTNGNKLYELVKKYSIPGTATAALSVAGANPILVGLGGAMLGGMASKNAIQNRLITSKTFSALTRDLAQTNPNSAKFIDKMSALLGYLSGEQASANE